MRLDLRPRSRPAVLRVVRLGLWVAVLGCAAGACYTGGGGTDPPTSEFYYPVGLAVSKGGNVLYAANSDFDLQWNGGTLQAYDLYEIRHDAAVLTQAALNGKAFPPTMSSPPASNTPFLYSSPVEPHIIQWPSADGGGAPCYAQPPLPTNDGTSIGLKLGTNCAPPMLSDPYQRYSAVIGAFATDLQLSVDGTRLFAPVRGNATVTWANVGADSTTTPPPTSDSAFHINCGQPMSGGRCASLYETGDDPYSCENTRNLTMPGEPFGLAQSEDGTVMVVTSQTTTEVSLLTTGFIAPGATMPPVPAPDCLPPTQPTMQFVAQNVVNGGNGIVAIPHDPNVVVWQADQSPPCPPNPGPGELCVQPAFLETSRDVAQLQLLRYYPDDGSTLHRPYLQPETTFPLTSVSGGGADSRGIAIDTTERLACEALVKSPGNTLPFSLLQCGEIPARVFFANRSANVLGTGTIGNFSSQGDQDYNPDLFVETGNVPLPAGPSRVYIAPIVDSSGLLEVRIFVVCFDSSLLVIYDPNYGVIENQVPVGTGPYAMAFDPFDLGSVATNAPVKDATYRYAYIGSFTQSYVQVIDLDQRSPQTFERVVFTLGNPTPPKGQ